MSMMERKQNGEKKTITSHLQSGIFNWCGNRNVSLECLMSDDGYDERKLSR